MNVFKKIKCIYRVWNLDGTEDKIQKIKCKTHVNVTFHFQFFKRVLLLLDVFQILEEPGEDNTKFDNIVPTIVKPKTSEKFVVESALEGHVG